MIISAIDTSTETDIDTITRHKMDVVIAMMITNLMHRTVRPGTSGSPKKGSWCDTRNRGGLCLLYSTKVLSFKVST